MNWKRIVPLALVVCALLSGCKAHDGMAIDIKPSERALQDARKQYRSADLVVCGTCMLSHIDAYGNTCYDLKIGDVLAGDAGSTDIIHAANKKMQIGDEYLLYLAKSGDTFHAEDMDKYTLLSDKPLLMRGGYVSLDGQIIKFNTILDDMRRQDNVVSAYGSGLYYDDLGSLVNDSDQIFIGRVVSVPKADKKSFRAMDEGVNVERDILSSIVEVEAYGSIKGNFKYGDSVSLCYANERFEDLRDSRTLSVHQYDKNDIPKLTENGIYIFYTKNGPDAKQNIAFPVNPLQGYVGLEEDKLVFSTDEQGVFQSFSTLTDIVKWMQTIMQDR